MELTPIRKSLVDFYLKVDPRIPVAFVLLVYLALGLTILGFHRAPLQVLITTAVCLVLEVFCSLVFRRKLVFPLSIFITSLSLSFLLSYGGGNYLLFVPVFYAVASKYLLTYDGKHFFNPAGFAVNLSILTSNKLITAASASQWSPLGIMPAVVIFFGLVFVIPKVKRTWLVLSYLFFFLVFAMVRAVFDVDAISPEVLIWGTLSSASFLIFVLFMITDPATSPSLIKDQLIVGFSLAFIDFLLHLRQSYYTFFFSLLILSSIRFIYRHSFRASLEGVGPYFKKRFWESKYYRRPLFFGGLFLAGFGFYQNKIHPEAGLDHLTWGYEKVSPEYSGLNDNHNGKVDKLLDPRIRHIGKFQVGYDAVAIGDVDGDGLQDIFLTNQLKIKEERCALYKNIGKHKFQRLQIPILRQICDYPEKNGAISHAIFVDYDNSGVQSLFLSAMSGHPYLLKFRTDGAGNPDLADVSEEAGLTKIYTNSLGATFADFNKDGLLDIIVTSKHPEFLPNYKTPHRLNLFHLPDPEYQNDKRMLDIMPNDPFREATNGGPKILLLQTPDHRFLRQDAFAWGMPEMHWSYVVGAADLNQDNWPDIYGVRDFGPDDIYLNIEGKKFFNLTLERKRLHHSRFNNNGMNQSMADYDRTGWLGVYVSHVHHAFQAEGSALWMFSPGKNPLYPEVEERAAEKGIKNEDRLGWGAVAVDFSNEGWVGIAQANGGFDDVWDGTSGKCSDYFYFMEKIARSPPTYFRYANFWPTDLGTCMFPRERHRIYLNRGTAAKPQFVDVADWVGVTDISNSTSGVASADFENSGRMDLLFTRVRAEPFFYRNVAKLEDRNEWIGFELESLDPKCNREAIGTKVTLSVSKLEEPGFSIMQEKQAVSGFLAQSDKRIHFGLGSGAVSISAKIDWCYGVKTEHLENLKANKYYKIVLKP